MRARTRCTGRPQQQGCVETTPEKQKSQLHPLHVMSAVLRNELWVARIGPWKDFRYVQGPCPIRVHMQYIRQESVKAVQISVMKLSNFGAQKVPEPVHR